MRYLFTRIRLLTSSRYLYKACFSYACSVLCELDYKGSSSVSFREWRRLGSSASRRRSTCSSPATRLMSGVPGIDGHPGNDNGSADCRPADDRALAE
jgi:hypothetical protein